MKYLDIVKDEISTDGKTVWVNGPSVCIGRFGRGGVDVHRDAAGQMDSGDACLDCFTDGTPAEMWDRFRASMLKFHDVDVPENFRPEFAKEVR